MSVNIGAAVSINLTPILSKFFGWHVAFSVCCARLIIAIFNFFMRGSIADYGSKPDQSPLGLHYLMYVLLGHGRACCWRVFLVNSFSNNLLAPFYRNSGFIADLFCFNGES